MFGISYVVWNFIQFGVFTALLRWCSQLSCWCFVCCCLSKFLCCCCIITDAVLLQFLSESVMITPWRYVVAVIPFSQLDVALMLCEIYS